MHFVAEAFRHCKAVGAVGDGIALLDTARLTSVHQADGSAGERRGSRHRDGPRTREFLEAFIEAVAAHRHYVREIARVPA